MKRPIKKAAKKGAAAPVIDPYLPRNGNFGYRVSRYELDLEYKVAINRLAGMATITAVTLASLQTFTLDLSDALAVNKVSVNGRRPTHFRGSGGKLHITLGAPLPAGAALSIAVRYGGSPRPVRTVWGEVGFEELSNGALVAGQPNGAASWFPCDDHPSSKASYRFQISTDSPYRAVANGELMSKRVRAGHTVWTYEQPEPTSTYLATLQIGQYTSHTLPKTPVRMQAVLPDRLRANFDQSFARQPQMMKLFVKLFGPYPLANGYTVVVTDDPVARLDLHAAEAHRRARADPQAGRVPVEQPPDVGVDPGEAADGGDLLGAGIQATQHLGRVAAEIFEQEEHQQHHAGQRGDHLPEAAYQVSGHSCRIVGEPGPGKRRSWRARRNRDARV